MVCYSEIIPLVSSFSEKYYLFAGVVAFPDALISFLRFTGI
ncbi:MAG: hypothetical protein QOF56_2760 [Acidobacteriaceae bacterium]|jgi:hypothetical protein|nr:hypothetical protein [Acidobacteriaceae bacterium]